MKKYCLWLSEFGDKKNISKKTIKVCKPFYGLPHVDEEFKDYYEDNQFVCWSKHLGRDFTADEVLQLLKEYEAKGYLIEIHSL